ncbi:hypothetical protein, partial [Limnoraphis robusta]
RQNLSSYQFLICLNRWNHRPFTAVRMSKENILAELTPRKQLFFQRFIDTYKNKWSSRLG